MEHFVYTDRIANEGYNSVLISVSYYKGRGIYLHCHKAKREHGTYEVVFDFNKRTHDSICLEQMSRGNAKKLANYEALTTQAAEAIADAFLDGDMEGARDLVIYGHRTIK